MFGSTLLIRANVADPSTAEQNLQPGIEQPHQRADCGGEPCDAVARGLSRFFDRTPDGLGGNGRACADCHMATDHFQLSPASVEARFQFLQWRRRFESGCRRSAVPADRRGRFPDQRRRRQRFQQPSPERSRQDHLPAATEHQAHRSRDQRAVDRDVRRRVAQRADRQRRRADRTGRSNPWPREPERDRRLPVGRARHDASGAGARRAHQSRADPERAGAAASRRPVLVSAGAVHEPSRSRAVRRRRAGTTPLPDPDPRAQRARAAGQGRLRARVRPVPRRPRAVDPAVPGRSVSQHLEPVPASGRHRDARSLRVCAVPAATRPQCADLRDRAVLPTQGPTGHPAGTKVRRTSSDPGRALLTGFVGGPGPQDDWDKFDVPGLRGISKTAPYFHNNSAATLEDVVDHYIEFFKRVQAMGAGRRATGRDDGRRELRPAPDSRRACRAARVPAEALACVRQTTAILRSPRQRAGPCMSAPQRQSAVSRSRPSCPSCLSCPRSRRRFPWLTDRPRRCIERWPCRFAHRRRRHAPPGGRP